MDILQEMYFGKVIALQQLEDVITKIKIKYETEANTNVNAVYYEVNKDDLVKKMAELIRDQFGFGEVIVTITRKKKMSASTISFLADKNGIAYGDDMKKIDLKDVVVMTSEGIRYDTQKFKPNILILISIPLLFSKSITSEQLVAILLHEIGHSFSKATIGSNNFNSRIDEKFADQFATMYGYGPELNKALMYITMKSKYEEPETIKDIPILNVFVGLKNIGKAIWSSVNGNPHPSLDRRMQDSIKQMQYELDRSQNLTVSQRKELQKNIDYSKETIEQFYNDSPTAPHVMYKYFMKNIEPNLPMETRENEYAERYGSIDFVNKSLSEFRKKKRRLKYGNIKTSKSKM